MDLPCLRVSHRMVRFAVMQQQQQRLFLSTMPPPKKPSAPRFQVPVHIALFTVLMIPVGLSMGYASHFGKKEDDLEAEIRARYQAKMDDSGIAEKNRHMGAYFQQVFHDRNNQEVEQQLRSVLEGGKDAHTKGRQRKYDDLGEKLRQAAVAAPVSSLEDEEEESSSKKKRRKKKKKKQKAEDVENNTSVEVKAMTMSPSTVTTVASVTAVATVAAVVGFVLGGSRRSS